MSQFARIAWIIVAGFVAMELIAHAVRVHDETVSATAAYATAVTDRALALERLLRNAPPEEQQRLLSAAAAPGFRASLQSTEPGLPPDTWRHADEIHAELAAHLKDAGAHDTRVGLSEERTVTVVVPRHADGYLVVRADSTDVGPRARPALVGTLTTLLVAALVLWATRRSIRHLPRFAEAAEALGRNAAAPELAEVGPHEVRRAAAAFNEMARRVRGYLDERTQILAAVSHDIRTQLTRLAMRIEYVTDPDQRARAREDVAQMTRLLDSVLAFSREDRAEEMPIALDIATLLDTLTDDERALGHRAQYIGPIHCVIDGRPTALRRAFTNLIDNAVRYGGQADVALALSSDERRVVIEIADRGPGIASHDRERVLQPFQRVDPSRNRTTGGTGLGLAIAHTVVTRHGGSLTFADRPGGGLIVRVELDRSPR